MGIWDNIFGGKAKQTQLPLFETEFGRFTDANKTKSQYEAWDKSVSHFENRDYQAALEEFIHYIQNFSGNNIIKENISSYIIFQGSKSILLSTKNGQLSASCKVATTDQLHIGFMRRLLDLNYELKYVRYALTPDNVVTLLFETSLEDASPYKLYFALKELAIHADKQDDLLIHEFEFLKPIHSGKIEIPEQEELNQKFQFFISKIETALTQYESGKLKAEQYPSAGAYVLLALLYKLDYLVRPEGKLMDRLEQMHKAYFGQNQKNILQRLKQFKDDLTQLRRLQEPEVKKDLYHSVFTFGFTSPANISASFELIDREMRNIQWYTDNQYDEYIIAILEYAIGLSLFNFALPEVIKELFTIVYRITESDYFDHIKGYDKLVNINGLPDKSTIRQELYRIEKKYKNEYPAMVMDVKVLKYENIGVFLVSYILMIRQIQFQKTK